ncbi:hypothetical protein T265_06458 [Opisthorchis viverrini]|uniref:Uncharacterized protein n=1 Tax=Opisthorchis viverrini TaxID=6198 RepID=A0A074ZSD0_OPIVI|nr:hypothetical protein T265_06458 [Opisthorchis viverrini]KER26265.1 hypothetical protein T265_06458 [Opisthorchis viverrini]
MSFVSVIGDWTEAIWNKALGLYDRQPEQLLLQIVSDIELEVRLNKHNVLTPNSPGAKYNLSVTGRQGVADVTLLVIYIMESSFNLPSRHPVPLGSSSKHVCIGTSQHLTAKNARVTV